MLCFKLKLHKLIIQFKFGRREDISSKCVECKREVEDDSLYSGCKEAKLGEEN